MRWGGPIDTEACIHGLGQVARVTGCTCAWVGHDSMALSWGGVLREMSIMDEGAWRDRPTDFALGGDFG
jgi:hypothetical protein